MQGVGGKSPVLWSGLGGRCGSLTWGVSQGPGKVGQCGRGLGKRGGVTGVTCVTGVAQEADMGVLIPTLLSKDHTRRCDLRRSPIPLPNRTGPVACWTYSR